MTKRIMIINKNLKFAIVPFDKLEKNKETGRAESVRTYEIYRNDKLTKFVGFATDDDAIDFANENIVEGAEFWYSKS